MSLVFNELCCGQWRSQNEAKEAISPLETNLLRFFTGALH